jgi:hypothetical protein
MVAIKQVGYLVASVGYQYWGVVVYRATDSWALGLLVGLAGAGLCLYYALSAGDSGPPGPPPAGGAFCDGLDDPACRS